jgi:hypothetical protein
MGKKICILLFFIIIFGVLPAVAGILTHNILVGVGVWFGFSVIGMVIESIRSGKASSNTEE